LSVSGINADFGIAGGRPGAHDLLPEVAAAAGDARAVALFHERAVQLASLCCARLVDVQRARGAVLSRIVIGQRLGQLLLDPRLEECFAKPARDALREQLQAGAPAEIREAWIASGGLVPGRLVASPLRAAAALGALALELAGD